MTISMSPSLSRSPKAQPRPRFAAVIAGAGARRHVFEASVAQIAIEQPGLPIRDVQLAAGDLRIHVAVGDEDVLAPVVVEIEEPDAESHVLAC